MAMIFVVCRKMKVISLTPGNIWLKKHGVELVICVTAALRRGLLDSVEAEQQKKLSNLAVGFTI